MAVEDGTESELTEETSELSEDAHDPGVEVARAEASNRWSKITPLVCGALLVIAGIVVFEWAGWMLGATWGSAGSRWLERSGPPDGFMAGPGVFFAITAVVVIKGLRGRGYKRWLLLAVGPLVGIVAAKALEIWFFAGPR